MYTPLYIDASEGHASVVKLLLVSRVPTDCMIVTIFLWICAASRGHFDAVQLLLQIGAHRDYHNYTGGTPLFLAARNVVTKRESGSCYKLNADMEIDFERKPPRFVAAENGRTNVVL